MWTILFRIFILFVHMNYIISLIAFPFKISESQDKSFEIRNDLHSETYLGDSKQLTDLFYYTEEHLYFIDQESCKGKNFFIKNFSEYDKSHYSIDLYEGEKAYEIKETIYLYKDLNLSIIEKIDDFPFLIKESTLKYYDKGCVLLGILYRTDNQTRKINFLEKLKERELINNYVWTFKYTNENEGFFIIGEEPHKYDPDNYNESNYLITKPIVGKHIYGWLFTLEKVYIGESLFPKSINGRISFSNNYILSDELYNQTIYKQYFKEYSDKKICFYKSVSFGHSYYYCEKDKFTFQDMKKFPTLKMLNLQLEMNFTFTGEELFYEGKDYYYFKINFMKDSQGGWILGQLFLRKYQLAFDNDGKTIGYYNNFRIPNKDEEEEKGERNLIDSNYKIYLYILIPLTVIVLAAIIFVLTKLECCNKKRKKKVNELIDEDNEDYFNINSDNKGSKENNEEDRKLYKSSE